MKTKQMAQGAGGRPARVQRGVALIVVMVMLVIIGLMSASIMRGALSADVVANNARAQNLAMQAAQIALHFCENSIPPKAGATLSIHAAHADNDGNPLTAAPTYWNEFSSWFPVSGRIATVMDVSLMQSADSSFAPSQLPECLAEKIVLEDGVTEAVVVTARGFSPDYQQDSSGRGTAGSVVWLQSTLH
jgi:Tfp pilus assembly protein PilX